MSRTKCNTNSIKILCSFPENKLEDFPEYPAVTDWDHLRASASEDVWLPEWSDTAKREICICTMTKSRTKAELGEYLQFAGLNPEIQKRKIYI